MHENLVSELNNRSEGVSRTKPPVQRRQVYAVEELEMEAESNCEDKGEEEIAAIHHANITCWYCDVKGHVWENCLAQRRIFCYGCGALNVYKPQCKVCIQRRSENRQKGVSTNNRMPLSK
ncbi:GH24668 [Drosophila grimshawi]|uniref:GH24668 n=1 Tax=Drosophila grimshawi TaxID=7222 RepID=B4K0X8_DROGR|nr:GH24668 [Drosophila grimshawi]